MKCINQVANHADPGPPIIVQTTLNIQLHLKFCCLASRGVQRTLVLAGKVEIEDPDPDCSADLLAPFAFEVETYYVDLRAVDAFHKEFVSGHAVVIR